MNIIKRQRLFFFSLAGIALISLIMITSFAYQKVQITYDTSAKQGVTINVGKLDVTFTTSNYINQTSMPLLNDYKHSDYTEFTLNNTNSTDNIYFKIMLSDLEYSSSLITEDFKYTLTEITEDSEEEIGSGDFKFLNDTTFTLCFNKNKDNYINKGTNKKIRLYLWLKETSNNQNYLKNANIKGKIEVNSYFESDANKMIISNLRIYGNSIQDDTPSEESPVEIKSLGEVGKNLFDENAMLENASVTKNEDGTYTNSKYPASYSSSTTLVKELKKNIKAGVTYTLSRQISNYVENSSGAIWIKNSTSNIIAVTSYVRMKSITFTLTQEQIDSIINIYIYGHVTNPTIFEWIQLEEGPSVTEHVPYKYITLVSHKVPIKKTIDMTTLDSLKKVGDFADYIDFSEGKLVRKIGVIPSYNGEAINTDYISTTGTLTTGATVYYVLENEVISDFDSSIINDLYNYGDLEIEANIKPSKIEFSI